ncbi:MAG: TonB-dependent receptor [Bacteroides sp.]
MKLILCVVYLFVSIGMTMAQTSKVTGVVTSEEDGSPVVGASVLVKGTSVGGITDIDGHFTLIGVPSSAKTLLVSFIGMKTEEVVIKAGLLKVVLKNDAQTLDEVVIQVAYGAAKKSSLTGAVSSVDAKKIEQRPVSSVSSVLEGTASGVQVNNTYGEPGSDATIRIRGFASINGSNDPLYVVDGVPYSANVSDLNTNDIESISVLKDAASAALYGSRAANGVIIITTKKGRNDKIGIRFNINQGIYNRGMADYDRLGANDFMETMWKGYRNSLLSDSPQKYPTVESANAKASASLMSDNLKYNIYNKADDALFDANGKLVADAQVRDGFKDDLDWYKDIERLGYRQEYNLSGDAANEKSNYYFSANYLDEKGYVKTSDFQRFTGRANINLTPKKWFQTGLSISGSHQISNNTSGSSSDASSYTNPFMYARQIAPIYPVHLHDMATGEYILDSFGQKLYDGGSENSRPQYLDRHVVWENELNLDRTYRNTLNSQLYANVKFLNDFTFTVKGDLNVRNSENQTYDNAIIGNGSGNQGRAKRIINRYKNYTFQQQLNWSRMFGDMHSVDVLLAHENYSYNYSYLYGYKTTQLFEGETDMVNFTKITSLYDYQNNYRTESYLSRARYNYNDKYFAEVAFRRDGSSRFHPDNRWGNFWSVGGSWIINREKFMEPLSDKINQLKLRASYGEVGNDAGVGFYGFMALYDVDQNANMGATYKSQNAAKDIKWETTSSFGIALEGRLFHRVNFSVEYFDKRSKDLLFDVSLPLSSGGTSTGAAEATVSMNLGSVSNRGVEVSADVDVLKTKNLRWNVGANVTALKNKILSLPEQNREKGIISGTKRYMEGHGVYDFWMYQYAGVDQMTGYCLYQPDFDKYYIGAAAVAGKDELPAENVVKVGDAYYTNYTTYAKKDWSGSAIPDVYGSVSTALEWKNFTLSALCTYAIGGKTLDYSYQGLMSMSGNPSALHKDLLKAWDGVPAGMTEDSPNRIDPNGIPMVNFTRSDKNNAISDRFLKNGSYFVLKNISLGYKLPKTLVNKVDLSDVSVNFSIENVATFTALKGMNPQQSFSGTNDNAFVAARVFSLGLSIRL